MPVANLKLAEIAARIGVHLARFESDPSVNKPAKGRVLHPYYWAGAWAAGRYVAVSYVQGVAYLSKQQALAYLKELDSGYVGKHRGVPGAHD